MSELNNILKIIEQLEKEQVDFIIIDELALILNGMPRTCDCLSIIVNMTKNNINNLRNALMILFKSKLIKKITNKQFKKYKTIRYISPEKDVIDLISLFENTFTYDNTEYYEMELEGIKVKVATPKSLIEMKSNTYREKDKLDLLFLKELIKRNTGN